MSEEAPVAADDAAEWAYRYGQAEAENHKLKQRVLAMWGMISTVSCKIDALEDVVFSTEEPSNEELGAAIKELLVINPWLELGIQIELVKPTAMPLSEEERDRIANTSGIGFDKAPPGLKEKVEDHVETGTEKVVEEWDQWAQEHQWSTVSTAIQRTADRIHKRLLKALLKGNKFAVYVVEGLKKSVTGSETA